MGELPAINGVPVIQGTALAAVVAVVPKDLLPLMPAQIVAALATLPASEIVAAVPQAAVMGAVVPAIKSDVYEKALISINATAAAALSVMAMAKV